MAVGDGAACRNRRKVWAMRWCRFLYHNQTAATASDQRRSATRSRRVGRARLRYEALVARKSQSRSGARRVPINGYLRNKISANSSVA